VSCNFFVPSLRLFYICIMSRYASRPLRVAPPIRKKQHQYGGDRRPHLSAEEYQIKKHMHRSYHVLTEQQLRLSEPRCDLDSYMAIQELKMRCHFTDVWYQGKFDQGHIDFMYRHCIPLINPLHITLDLHIYFAVRGIHIPMWRLW
jgi:hypothetical protein